MTFGIGDIQASPHYGHRRRASRRIGGAIQCALMGGSVHTQRQPAHHDQPGVGQGFGKFPRVDGPLRCGVAAADNGDAIGKGRIHVAVVGALQVQHQRRIADLQ